MDRWQGKVAVVTGASAGIGRAIMMRLANHGMIVVGIARRDDVIKDIASKTNSTIHAVKCDLALESDIVKAFQWVKDNLGGVDLLVNSAGILHLSSMIDGTTEVWRNVLEVNVIALSICTREALKTMRLRGDNGHIIHINSKAGHENLPMPKCGMYSASKHAVTSLSNALRSELKMANSKIRVTSLSPGIVHTDMAKAAMKSVNVEVPPLDQETPKDYLSIEDLADAVIGIITMKPNALIEEIIMVGM